MLRQIIYEYEGKEKLAQGIRRLCKVLAMEGGVLIKGKYSYSALQIGKEIESEDCWINQGIRLATDVIAEINKETGCGTGMAAKMTLSMLDECERLAASGENPIALAREISDAAIYLEKEVEMNREKTQKNMIALLYEMTGDEKLSAMIDQGITKGEVAIRESVSMETKLEITQGLRIENPLVCGKEVTLSNIDILVVEGKISSFYTLLPILEKLEGKGLFILADKIEGEALTMLQTNVSQGRINVWVMEAPGIGRRKKDFMGDFAVLTQTRVYQDFEITGQDFTLEKLGIAKKIAFIHNGCVVKGDSKTDAIKKRMEHIEERINEPGTNYYDQQILRERMAALSGEVPVIYAGGATLAQAKEEKLRLEYALAYAQTVRKYGIVNIKKIINRLQALQFASDVASNRGIPIIVKAITKSVAEEELSAWLLSLTVRKISSMLRSWLTTGAVMISVGYDREDRELMKSGVDVNRLRG